MLDGVLVEAAGRTQTRFAKGGGSYVSSSDRRLLFGLGKAERIDGLTVIWPSGVQQRWMGEQVRTDRYWRLVEGETKPQEPGGRKRSE